MSPFRYTHCPASGNDPDRIHSWQLPYQRPPNEHPTPAGSLIHDPSGPALFLHSRDFRDNVHQLLLQMLEEEAYRV